MKTLVGQPLDLTFVVLAYNEEAALRQTIEDCLSWMRKSGRVAQVLVMNDGSTDRSGAIADELATEYANVRVKHIERNAGQFNAIRTCWELVETTYYAIIPGDHQFVMASFDLFVPHIGRYDVIFGFPNNEEVRGKLRGVLSHLWRIYLLAFFGVSVVYLGGLVVLPVRLVKAMKIEHGGYLGLYELMVRICMSGANWIQIPFEMREREGGASGALRPWRNLTDLARMTRLWVRLKGPGLLPGGEEFEASRKAYAAYRAELQRRSVAHPELERRQGLRS